MYEHLKDHNSSISRREALKALAATSGAVALSSVPQRWQTPLVEVGNLPAHAQGTPSNVTEITSPADYPFENEAPDFDDVSGLETASLDGWVALDDGTLSSSQAPWLPPGRPWININRRWEVLTPPWSRGRKVKIKYDFKAKSGYGSSRKLKDNNDFWFYIAAGSSAYFGQYYVQKLKIKRNKIEIEFDLPPVGSGFFPFYCSGYFPFNLSLMGGYLLTPGYFLGPGIYGDKISLT